MLPSSAPGSGHAHAQAPREILMVRPAHFGYDLETAESNHFQHRPGPDEEAAARQGALEEFESAVGQFRKLGIKVRVFEDPEDGVCRPDAVFPNNWLSTHHDGSVILYPMLAASRRLERRQDVVDYLRENYQVRRVIDLSHHESSGQVLEGTGSLVLDHVSRTAFACRSPRTDADLVRQVADVLGYAHVVFDATDVDGATVYHTNVAMWVGTRVSAVCLDAIKDREDRQRLVSILQRGDRALVPLSLAEMSHFAGNCLELTAPDGRRLLAMSRRAADRLAGRKLDRIRDGFDDVVVCDVSRIEHVSGGGVRCMLAGVHLPERA